MKVAHLTSVHPPFDVRIFHKECRSLAMAGHEVVLVAPHDGPETRDGVRLHAVPKARGRLQRALKTTWRVYRAAVAEDARVYHFHDPELIPVGLLLKLHGKRVIYDVHEDVPEDVLTKAYLHPALRRAIAFAAGTLERLGAAAFDGVVTVTPGIARRFPAAKTHLVQNFPVEGELGGPTTRPYMDRPPHALYVGVINAERGLPQILDALDRLPGASPARLSLAGSFSPPALEASLKAMPGWAKVDFHGWQDRAGVRQLTEEARIGLVLFQPLPNHVEAQPNKLFEYMAAGLPVIASDFPRWRELVEGAGCGLLVDPASPQAIADAVTWLLDHPAEAQAMGQRGAAAVASRYNWTHEARTLVALYRGLER